MLEDEKQADGSMVYVKPPCNYLPLLTSDPVWPTLRNTVGKIGPASTFPIYKALFQWR